MPESTSMDVSVKSVKDMLDAEESFLLLDCRRQEEYDFVNLPNATLIPMDELQGRLSEIEDAKDEKIVVYCHHGVRSLMVVEWLRMQGFALAQSMTGGIEEWACTIDTSLRKY